MESNILIISDEPSTSRIWGLCLTELHCSPLLVNSVAQALPLLEEHPADLAVVDVTSKNVSGVKICEDLREQSAIPILLLTPINNESHTLEIYQAGADECIIKPISPSLLLAKVRVWLYRTQTIQLDTLDKLTIGDFTLDPSIHQLLNKNGKKVRLSNLEFRVLYLLMNHPNQSFSHDEIVKRIWGYYGHGTSTLVKNVVYRLRKKIEPDPSKMKYIRTVTGGYAFRR